MAHVRTLWGLPWRLTGKESSCQRRRHRFDPWSRKIPRAKGQLSLYIQLLSLFSGAQESQLLQPKLPRACALQQEKTPQWEAPILQLESSPCSPKLEKNPSSNKDPAKGKKKLFRFVFRKTHNEQIHGFLNDSGDEESTCNAEDPVDAGSIPGSGRSPGGGKATHSSILAWKIRRTEEPGGLQSEGSQRVWHNWTNKQHQLFFYG